MSGHPPFGALVILNGHEYVTAGDGARGPLHQGRELLHRLGRSRNLNRVADTLRSPTRCRRCNRFCGVGFLVPVSGVGSAEQEKMQCQYPYSVFQIEYSRNLLFRGGRGSGNRLSGV